jgi:hypothetical protein
MDDTTTGVPISTAAAGEAMEALKKQASFAEDYYKKLASQVKETFKEDKMAEIMTPGGIMMGGGGGDMFGSGGGLIGGLILGSLLRNNGNLFGGNGGDGVVGAVATQAGVQSVVNQSAIQQELADLKAAVPLAEASLQAALAAQQNAIQQNIFQAQTVTQAGFAAQVQNLNQIENNILRETAGLNAAVANVDRNLAVQTGVLTAVVKDDGEKTRALITAQYEAALNRQLSDANAEIIALRNKQELASATRGVEVTTTNNINQMQQQQQQQQQYGQLANLIWSLGQNIQNSNAAINVGSGTQTANPANTNTNIR